MQPNTAVAGDGGGKSSGNRRSLVRKRPVSFGISRNYHWNVYTIHSDDSVSDDEMSDNKDFSLQSSSAVNRRTLAMIGVPPEHVPEGVLNLIRSYRPFVEHVRVVIADSDDEDDGDGNNGGDEKEEIDNNKKNFGLDDDTTAKQRRDRTYLILVQLFREEDATMFVEDLDGQPYIAFDDRDTCRIERVVSVETTVTMTGTNTSTPLLSVQPNEGPQQSDGKSSQNHPYHQSLPLLHPNFGTPMPNNTTGRGPPQEEKMGEQKSSSRCVNTPITNREDSKINCAVCLEDLGLEEKKLDDGNALLAATDGATSAVCTPVTASHPSLLTTVCNHTFHLDCLQQCTGPCPVCRYDHSGLNETLSQCHVCRTTEHNYVCLICGVVSCGIPYTAEAVPPVAAAASSTTASTTTAPPRFYTSSHAGQHYRDTLHAYALDTETQHVYDFCGQGYVHRLVQNKEDGKLVEVNDPRQSSAVARGRTPGERSLTPGLSNAQEGEVVHRKLEGAAEQYNTLLKSQLEQQRAYYEERMNDVKREFSAEHQRTKAQDLLSVLRQERKQVTQRLSTLQRRKAKVAETVAFLTDMNESLESNKVALKHRIQQAVREQNDSKETVLGYLPELEAKLSELMKQLID
jgi:BRCA1-associated protein